VGRKGENPGKSGGKKEEAAAWEKIRDRKPFNSKTGKGKMMGKNRRFPAHPRGGGERKKRASILEIARGTSLQYFPFFVKRGGQSIEKRCFDI